MVGGLISSTWLVFRGGFMYLNILFSPFFLAELTLSLPDSTFLVGLELCLDGINFSLGLVPSLFCESFFLKPLLLNQLGPFLLFLLYLGDHPSYRKWWDFGLVVGGECYSSNLVVQMFGL